VTRVHRQWQRRRSWIAHQFLANSVSNVLLNVVTAVEPGSILDQVQWKRKLDEWLVGFDRALTLIQEGANALSPARFFEGNSWPTLSPAERRDVGRTLEEDWLRSTKVEMGITKAERSLRAAMRTCTYADKSLERQGVNSAAFRKRLIGLLAKVTNVNTALKDLNVDVIWVGKKCA
jgi:hypothetical protein